MTIKEYIENYTLGSRIKFSDVWCEVKELLVEVVKFDKEGVKEEFGDVANFLQMFLYWRFGLNDEIWRLGKRSADKFMKRKEVWQELYVFCGLDKNISNFAGNYNKLEKVIKQLNNFGIDKEIAENAYYKIIFKIHNS